MSWIMQYIRSQDRFSQAVHAHRSDGLISKEDLKSYNAVLSTYAVVNLTTLLGTSMLLLRLFTKSSLRRAATWIKMAVFFASLAGVAILPQVVVYPQMKASLADYNAKYAK